MKVEAYEIEESNYDLSPESILRHMEVRIRIDKYEARSRKKNFRVQSSVGVGTKRKNHRVRLNGECPVCWPRRLVEEKRITGERNDGVVSWDELSPNGEWLHRCMTLRERLSGIALKHRKSVIRTGEVIEAIYNQILWNWRVRFYVMWVDAYLSHAESMNRRTVSGAFLISPLPVLGLDGFKRIHEFEDFPSEGIGQRFLDDLLGGLTAFLEVVYEGEPLSIPEEPSKKETPEELIDVELMVVEEVNSVRESLWQEVRNLRCDKRSLFESWLEIEPNNHSNIVRVVEILRAVGEYGDEIPIEVLNEEPGGCLLRTYNAFGGKTESAMKRVGYKRPW